MSKPPKGHGGRKEVLTLELARKIVTLIERMPESEIPVNWNSIERHVKKKFGKDLKRNVLSSKDWNGRKLIYDAYTAAVNVQKRLQKQGAPKYANSSRGVLRNRIGQLEANVLALKQELEDARLAQLTQLDLFRATRLDLRRLAEDALRGKESS